jgi:hypothetical protein
MHAKADTESHRFFTVGRTRSFLHSAIQNRIALLFLASWISAGRQVFLRPFREEAEAHANTGQFCLDPKTPQDYNKVSLEKAPDVPQSESHEGQGGI